jgi:hypothetical protein
MGQRTWFKVYPDRWLNGSLRQESLEFKGAWAEILNLAAYGVYGDSGEIKLTDNVGVSDASLASIMSISVKRWRRLKARMVTTNRISVDKMNIIKVLKWSAYQSEYERQKPYRKVTREVTSMVTLEKEKEIIEKEKEIRKGVRVLHLLLRRSMTLIITIRMRKITTLVASSVMSLSIKGE